MGEVLDNYFQRVYKNYRETPKKIAIDTPSAKEGGFKGEHRRAKSTQYSKRFSPNKIFDDPSQFNKIEKFFNKQKNLSQTLALTNHCNKPFVRNIRESTQIHNEISKFVFQLITPAKKQAELRERIHDEDLKFKKALDSISYRLLDKRKSDLDVDINKYMSE